MRNSSVVSVRLARCRRPLAALMAALGVVLALLAVRPGALPTGEVLAAARDLPGGAVLRPRDVKVVALPPEAVPSGALRPGRARDPSAPRILAGPVRRGEVLTDMRLVSGGLLRGYGPDVVATPVRVADAGAVRLLRPGDRVDVLSSGSAAQIEFDSPVPGRARPVASAVPVVAVPREPAGSGEQGGLVVLATSREQAVALAGAAGTRLSVTIAAG